MATRTEPGQTFVSCDVCGVEDPRGARNRFKLSGGLVVKKDALDFQDAPVADGSVKRDLCDECLAIIAKTVNAVAERLSKKLFDPVEVVFDGPPGPEGPRFVEAERAGSSICLGEWVHRDDGYWVIRFDPLDVL